jgi:hypothetical protein
VAVVRLMRTGHCNLGNRDLVDLLGVEPTILREEGLKGDKGARIFYNQKHHYGIY